MDSKMKHSDYVYKPIDVWFRCDKLFCMYCGAKLHEVTIGGMECPNCKCQFTTFYDPNHRQTLTCYNNPNTIRHS